MGFDMEWTAEAKDLITEVPFFVRSAVRKRIESLAGAEGVGVVDADFYGKAKYCFNQCKGYDKNNLCGGECIFPSRR
eukprot:g58147.t1